MRKHVLWLALTWLAVAPASAEPPPVDVQHFQPHTDQRGWFSTQSAATLDLWQPAFSAWFTYARDPLLFEYPDGTFDRVVGDLASLDLQAAIGFRYADLSVDVPVHLRVAGDGLSDWSEPFGATALGDIRVVPKVRFLDPDVQGIGLGLALPLSLPSGNESSYVGRSSVAFSPAVLVAVHAGPVRFGGNLGGRFTKQEQVGALVSGLAFQYSLGVALTAHPVVDFVGEVFGEVRGEERSNPAEWLAGATFHPVPSLGVSIAGGTSMGHGIGAPEGRVLFGIGFSPSPPRDGDGDGIIDARDICPEEPETVNGFQDDDGCPDDADRDGDGIADNDDDCPDDPEDKDNFEDEDGCPDPDNDGDGIPDSDDRCRNEPETVNGVEDDDGCPDEGIAQFDEVKKEIIIYEKVYFEVNKATILPQSHRVLDAVKDVLLAYDRILKVEVQGHTDTQGSADHNMKLSQERADAVRDYLMGRGIEGSRLTAVGYGEAEPVDPGDDEVAHARNRRVQFIVLEME